MNEALEALEKLSEMAHATYDEYSEMGGGPENERLEKIIRARIAEIEAQNARLADVHAYLLGDAPLNGRWFGDDLPPKAPRFWWRRHLRQAIDKARE